MFCTFGLTATGQYIHPPYRQYTLRDGLPQMQMWSMFQDSRGYMWIGTKGGLSCFDGEMFTNYTEKDGLADNLIESIQEDYGGRIWIVTGTGLSSFDGLTINTYPFPHLDFRISPTPDGKIWYIGTKAPSVSLFGYLEDGKFTSLIDKYPAISSLTAKGIYYSAPRKSLLLAADHKIFELKDGKMNLLKAGSGEMRMEKIDSTIAFYEWDALNNVNVYELQNGNIIEVAQIKNGKLAGNNLAQLHHQFINLKARSQIISLGPNTYEIKDFPDQYLNVCLVDQDQHLWLGAEEGLIQNFSGGFETYKREFLPMIWSITEDRRQNIWFASLNFGLMKYDGKTIVNYPAKSLTRYGSYFYFQAQADENGVLYFPNNFGIVYYDGQSFGSLPNTLCWASYYDKTRKLLFGGFSKRIEVYNRNRQRVRLIDEKNGLPIKGAVAALENDRHGNLWVGGATGLARYNWETNKFKNYGGTSVKPNGVVSIYTEPSGTTWFGGTHGLLWYDEKTDSVRKVESEEIPEIVNLVNSIDSTWLVFSQPTGIYLMDLKKFRKEGRVDLQLFNERNGFGGLEPGQNGAMKDSNGNIWMTTGTEVVKLDPKALDFSKTKINVRITGFNGKPAGYDQKQLALPKNDRTAVVQFETICFNRPKSARYSWKIDESDTEWSAWQNEDYAVLANLPDGQTTFHIRTKIPGLPDSEVSTSIKLVVSVAIWKQAWFFPTLLVFVSLLVLLTIVLLIQTRMQMIQINKQAKTFQLQAILSQMNPHFIFNVMAALQSMILSANIEKANDYLVRMSNLVRGFLEASISTSSSKSKRLKNGELPLKKELEVLQTFIEFQQLIYPEKFEYRLDIDSRIDPDKISIPPMLIQPFVENAIRHGLLQKEKDGLLQIKIDMEERNQLSIIISDNGIGIRKAREIIGKSPLLYTSRGRELTEKRIKLLNEMGYRIIYQTTSSDQGTTVTLKIGKYES